MVGARHRHGLLGLVQQRLEALLELRRLAVEVRPVHPEMAVEVLAKHCHRLQQNIGSLEWCELAEETEPVTRPLLVRNAYLPDRSPTVLLEDHLLWRKAPLQVTVHEKAAGCEEAVHECEL